MMPQSVTERMDRHPCVAHRGWSGKAPENTMAAFRLAVSEPSVQWMELDVHLSRDQIPVVIHDPTLKRTTNGDGRVSEWTAAELKRLDAGSWFSPAFAGEGVPALDEVLSLAAGRCRLNIEIKGEDSPPKLIARKVIELIAERRMEHDVVITSFRPEVLLAVREVSAGIATGLIIDDQPPELIPFVRSLGASFLSIGFRHLTGPLLQEAEDARVTVMAWTVNQPADLKRIVNRPEPILVCTNYPDRWQAAIDKLEET
jgi:glycerophosphoryl diester phosphodiesterase